VKSIGIAQVLTTPALGGETLCRARESAPSDANSSTTSSVLNEGLDAGLTPRSAVPARSSPQRLPDWTAFSTSPRSQSCEGPEVNRLLPGPATAEILQYVKFAESYKSRAAT